jgi:hypothetical protein
MEQPVDSIEEFSELLIKSELVNQRKFESLYTSFINSFASQSTAGISLTSWISYLIKEDVVSCWQCFKLRQRKYKGFFLDQYKLIDFHGLQEGGNVYLVEKEPGQRLIKLWVQNVGKGKGQDGLAVNFKELGPV